MAKQVITLVNRKGGTGKTTSAAYIAAALKANGHDVVGLDADPDASWIKMASMGMLDYEVIPVKSENIREHVDNATGFVVIDTPPNDEAIIFHVARVADHVIIPISPTGLDIGRLKTTALTVGAVEEMRDKDLAHVLITRHRPRLLVARYVLEVLEKERYPVLESRIRLLTQYEQIGELTQLDEYEAVLKELEIL